MAKNAPVATETRVTLKAISSMATRKVLADLAAACARETAATVTVESVGGVDAARRVLAGEPFDAVFLAADAIDRLVAGGAVVAGSRVDLVRSPMAVAVRAGTPRPDIGSEEALRAAVAAAPRIGYSSGPSGTHLVQLFERWGLAEAIAGRLVQAPPGVPVASLVAGGDVAIGFQQLPELMHFAGIDVVGTLPPGAAFITTFSGAVCAASTQGAAVRAMLASMAAPATAPIKRRHGLEPA